MATTYRGDPTAFPIQLTLFDGSVPPTAANLNVVQEGELDRSAYLGAHALIGAITKFEAPVSSGGPFTGAGPYATCFNDRPLASNEQSAQEWLVSGYSGGAWSVYRNPGCDGTWTQVGSTITWSNPLTSLVVATTGSIFAASTDGAHIALWKNAVGGGTFVVVTTTLPLASCTDVKIAQAPNGSGSAIYIAAGTSTANAAELGSSTDAGSVGMTAPGVSATTWILRSNGSYALAIPAQALAVSGQLAWKSNAAGSSWTGTAIGLAATDVPVDLCWNVLRQQWLLAVDPGGVGFTTTFYTSSDGVAWTNTGTTLHNTNGFVRVAAVGPYYFGLDSDGSGTPVFRLFSCTDAGITWRATAMRMIGNNAGNIGLLETSPMGLAIAAGLAPLGAGTSNTAIRFSSAGIGDQIVT